MEEPTFGRVMIVGGSGMLMGASRRIVPHADSVVLLSRSPMAAASRLGARGIALDWRDRSGAAAIIGSLPTADLLISWLHDDGVWLAGALEAKLAGGARSVRVHGAASRDPAVRARRDPNPRSDLHRQTVILGWAEGPGGTRWLTDEEISGAVCEAVFDPSRETVIVGTLDGEPPDG